MQSLGEFLRYSRKSKGITQDELASEMHVVSPVISKWENGKSIPNLAALCKLCNILEISLEECVACCKLDIPMVLPPENYDAQRLGERLRDLRIKNNLSQSEVGKDLFVTSQTISRWESGEISSLENLQMICQYYQVAISYVFQDGLTPNFVNEFDENFQNEIFSKSIDPLPKPTAPKNYFTKLIFVLSAIIVVVTLSVVSINAALTHNHSLIYFEAVSPTCDTAGNIAYWQCEECKKCFSDSNGDNQIEGLTIRAKEHDFGDWLETKQATCTQEGEVIRYCANENAHKETRTLPILPHKLVYTNDKYTHTLKCSDCLQEFDTDAPHTYEDDICTVCGWVKDTKFECIAPLDDYTLGQLYSTEYVFDKTHLHWTTHLGVDFTAPAGSEVKCIFDGTVKEISEDSYSGTVVTIEHSNGFTSVYKLICDSQLKVGDTVSQGDTVGKVSDTVLGEMDYDAHLHLELLKDEEKINPLDYMPDVKSPPEN